MIRQPPAGKLAHPPRRGATNLCDPALDKSCEPTPHGAKGEKKFCAGGVPGRTKELVLGAAAGLSRHRERLRTPSPHGATDGLLPFRLKGFEAQARRTAGSDTLPFHGSFPGSFPTKWQAFGSIRGCAKGGRRGARSNSTRFGRDPGRREHAFCARQMASPKNREVCYGDRTFCSAYHPLQQSAAKEPEFCRHRKAIRSFGGLGLQRRYLFVGGLVFCFYRSIE